MGGVWGSGGTLGTRCGSLPWRTEPVVQVVIQTDELRQTKDIALMRPITVRSIRRAFFELQSPAIGNPHLREALTAPANATDRPLARLDGPTLGCLAQFRCNRLSGYVLGAVNRDAVRWLRCPRGCQASTRNHAPSERSVADRPPMAVPAEW